MAGSTYSSNLKIELMTTGENSGTWGDVTNTNLGTALEQAVVGYGNPDYASDANLTISITNSNASQAARCLVLNVTSVFGSLTQTRELVVPTIQKQYIVQNNTTGGQSITVKTSAGTGITVPNGRKAHLYVNGTDVIQMFDYVDINGGSIDGTPIGASSASTGAFTTLTASGATTLNGSVALGDASADLITFPGTINSNLLFTDATYDIGASGANRPRDLFLSRNLVVGGTLTLAGGVNLNGNVTIGDSSADTLTIVSTITSNLLFTDNTYDIGASGATRPRNLFLAGNATIGGNQTLTGSLTVDSTTDSSSVLTGSIQTDGGLGVAKAVYVGTSLNVAGTSNLNGAVNLGDAAADNVTVNGTITSNLLFTDGTYDIGASGATRPRNLYLSSNAVIGGLTASKPVFTDANKQLTSSGTLLTDQGGTGQSSYTAGDLLYYASGTALTKLGIGAANTVLTSSGSAPQWSSSLTLAGNLVVNGNTTLGDATSDTITANARLASDLVPSTNNARDLGSSSLAYRSIYAATSFVENGYAVVTQADIGTAANEIPLNQYLGSMAYQDGTNYYNVGMTVGFRNRIINGAMQIDQRNAGASYSAINGGYSLDRWQTTSFEAGAVTGKYTVQQNAGAVTPPSGFSKYLGVTSSAATSIGANSIYSINQYIEGLNVIDLAWGTSAAKSVTISFWVRSSLTGTFGGAIVNSDGNRVYGFTYAINTASTWEYKTVTIAGDTSGTWLTTNATGVQVSFGLGGGASWSAPAGQWTTSLSYTADDCVSVVSTSGATWYITGVQFEVGTQATPFDWRPYTTELALCQRYYEKSYNIDVVPATGSASAGLVDISSTSNGANNSYVPIFFKTTKRATPTMTGYSYSAGTSGSWSYDRSGGSGTTTVSFGTTGQTMTSAYINIGVAWSACEVYGHWTASSEL